MKSFVIFCKLAMDGTRGKPRMKSIGGLMNTKNKGSPMKRIVLSVISMPSWILRVLYVLKRMHPRILSSAGTTLSARFKGFLRETVFLGGENPTMKNGTVLTGSITGKIMDRLIWTCRRLIKDVHDSRILRMRMMPVI